MENKFKVFKTITIGGTNKEELLARLESAGVQFNAYAKTLFADPQFIVSEKAEIVHLVKANLTVLGFDKPMYYKDIITKAEALGLKQCPLNLAAFLRLEFMEQTEGPYITVASVKTKNDEEYPNGLYVRRLDDILWLRGYRATFDVEWPVEHEFVFIADL